MDPSLVCSQIGDLLTKLVHDPLWKPAGDDASRVRIVDEALCSRSAIQENLQAQFAPAGQWLACENYEGCCVTVTMLVVLACLRFRCRDPQLMVNVLRDISIGGIRSISPMRINEAPMTERFG